MDSMYQLHFKVYQLRIIKKILDNQAGIFLITGSDMNNRRDLRVIQEKIDYYIRLDEKLNKTK